MRIFSYLRWLFCNIQHRSYYAHQSNQKVCRQRICLSISYIHAETYAAGELKHGPIALIDEGFPVISLITDETLAHKTISNIQEVISRGAKTVVVTNTTLDKSFDYVVKVPKTNKYLTPILSVVPLQLLSYYISKEKGLDVDKPRNLAKSVTVE